jgi:hypothetical protein
VVLGEIHRAPEIFSALRGLIDESPSAGYGSGRFLVPGSASIDLLRQSSESLAGRISCVGHLSRSNCRPTKRRYFGCAQGLWAIEIRPSLEGRPRRGFYDAWQDLKTDRRSVEKRR